MNSPFSTIFDAAPLYPNLEYEIRQSSLSFEEIAKAIHLKPASLRKKLSSPNGFYTDEVIALLKALKVHSMEYLMFCPRRDPLTEGAIVASYRIHTAMNAGVLCNSDSPQPLALAGLSALDRATGFIILQTCINLALMQMLPNQQPEVKKLNG